MSSIKGFRSAGDLLQSADWDGRIQRVAAKLNLRSMFRDQEPEDLAQSLRLGILERLRDMPLAEPMVEPCFRRALFCTAASMARSGEAQSRRINRDAISLNALVPCHDGQCVELQDCVSARKHEDVDLAIDLRDLLAHPTVSERDRAVANGLREGNRSVAARGLGLPRSTTHENVKRLRRVLKPLAPCAATSGLNRVVSEIGAHIDARTEVQPNVA